MRETGNCELNVDWSVSSVHPGVNVLQKIAPSHILGRKADAKLRIRTVLPSTSDSINIKV